MYALFSYMKLGGQFSQTALLDEPEASSLKELEDPQEAKSISNEVNVRRILDKPL